MEVADGNGMDGVSKVDTEVFSGGQSVNARAVKSGLTIALGEATSCAIDSVQCFFYGRGRESWIGSIPQRVWESGCHGISGRVTEALVKP